MNLFQLGDFTLRSGAKAAWKIECEALTSADWMALAKIASEVLPPFRMALGVPRGGIPFATALSLYATRDAPRILIAEDVVTTGGSMERYKAELMANAKMPFKNEDYIGVAAFARDRCPFWVTALFRMPGVYKVPDDGE